MIIKIGYYTMKLSFDNQTLDKVTSYPYCTNAGRSCKTALLEYLNIKLLTLMIWLMVIRQNII